MVKKMMFGGEESGPEGPCKIVRDEHWSYIRKLVSATKRDSKERAGAVLRYKGKGKEMDMLKGNEESISVEKMGRLMVYSGREAIEMASDTSIKTGDYDVYLIHTHPKGHYSPSLEDLKFIARENTTRVRKGSTATAHMIATETDRGIRLSAIYRDEPVGEGPMGDIQRELSYIEKEHIGNETIPEKKSILMTTLKQVGYDTCAVLGKKPAPKRDE